MVACPNSSPRTPSSSPSPVRPAAAPAPPREPPSATPTARTYLAATVTLPSLQLSALQAAVAAAVSSGVEGLEAAAVVRPPTRWSRRAGRRARPHPVGARCTSPGPTGALRTTV